jgi:protein arginine kinase
VQRSFRNGDGSLDCELNGTDHFRLRHHGFGPDWQAGFQRLHRLEAALEQVFPFAVNLEWGHLSASLANLGTALRAETWLHLPLAGGPDALAGAAGLPLAEGLALEATALPSVWRLSNRRTLGWGESEMISRLAAGARLLLHYTQAMARQARGREPADLEDRAWRCWGSLRHGRLLDRAELGAGLDRLRRGLLDGSFRGDGSDGGPAHWQISCLLVLLLAGAAPADGPGLAALVRRILETA